MRLRFTTGSPFARTVRIVLSELELEYEKTEELTTTAAEVRSLDAPTLQVPALVDGNTRLWDSLVIIEYLLGKYSPTRSDSISFVSTYLRENYQIEDRLQLATIQTLGTSTATISQLKWTGVAQENDFAAKNAERIGYLLNWLETQIASDEEGFVPGYVSVQDVMVASILMFIDNRPLGIQWRSHSNPKIQALIERMGNRSSFIENPIWWWEPGVVGYSEDGIPLYK